MTDLGIVAMGGKSHATAKQEALKILLSNKTEYLNIYSPRQLQTLLYFTTFNKYLSGECKRAIDSLKANLDFQAITEAKTRREQALLQEAQDR